MASRKRKQAHDGLAELQRDFDDLVYYLKDAHPEVEPQYIASLLSATYKGWNRCHSLVGAVASTAGAHSLSRASACLDLCSGPAGIARELFSSEEYITFQREDDRKWNALHVGEVVRPYNPITHEVRIHHFVDLGVSGKHWDPTKDLSSRRVYPEYSADGVSYVQKRSGVALKPGSQEVSIDYALHNRGSGRRITIIAKNFALQTGGKIPGDVCMKVREWLDARRPQQRR